MILHYLQHHSSPVTIRVLAEETGLPRRSVEEEIQRLRLEGVPVITSGDGVRLSSDPAEIRKCADRLRARALTQLETAASLKKAADSLPLTLWDAA